MLVFLLATPPENDMDLRRIVAIATLVLAPGALGWIACGGSISSSGAADASSESGGNSGSSGATGAGSSGGTGSNSSGSGSASGSGGGSSSGSSGSGGGADADTPDALTGSGEALDAAVPDAFPADCGVLTLTLRPDAAPNTCAFTPADVACDTSDDCIPYTLVSCGCIDGVYGLNKTNAVRCIPPPCPPPINGCPVSGLETQDCQVVATQQDVAVTCANHQCMTYAVGL
jgi:hypothetical protein